MILPKFCCTHEQGRKVEVVLELQSNGVLVKNAAPNHHIFLVDVSHSMNSKLGSKSLLERVKGFSMCLVDDISESDYLSIVSFGDYAKVVLKKTIMTSQNKKIAQNALKNFKTLLNTHLEDGLMKAIEVAGSTQNTKDGIILFTDGNATKGSKEADKLISLFNEKLKKVGRDHSIPVSAMTLGNYKPTLLMQISRKLGSDAFYWFDDKTDFEADMFTPVYLRRSTVVTDVSIKLTCTHSNVSFEKYSTEHIVPDASLDLGRSLKYFIHGLSNGTKKNIGFSIEIECDDLPQLNGRVIAKAEIEYLDENLNKRRVETDLIYRNETMMQVRNPQPWKSPVAGGVNIFPLLPPTHESRSSRNSFENNEGEAQDNQTLQETVAYIVQNGKAGTSWSEAKEAYAKIIEEKCRNATQDILAHMARYLERNCQDFSALYKQAHEVCDELKKTISLAFGESDPFAKSVHKKIEMFEDVVLSFNKLPKTKTQSMWNNLKSREISLAKEMPTSRGVFGETKASDVPYMPENTGLKLDETQERMRSGWTRVLPAGVSPGSQRKSLRKTGKNLP